LNLNYEKLLSSFAFHFNLRRYILATLLLYLNDAGAGGGGNTVFGRLGLEVEPKKGQCLLFFPATADGTFDERVEHAARGGIENKHSIDDAFQRIESAHLYAYSVIHPLQVSS